MEITCIGGIVRDVTYRARASLERGTSNIVATREGFGGVARNVAENLARLGRPVSLVSRVGSDGADILEHAGTAGIDTSRIETAEGPTARYVAVLEPDGSLAMGLADMAALDSLDAAFVVRADPRGAVFADCNLASDALEHLADSETITFLAIDAVSRAKVRRLPRDLTGIDLLFLNRDEAEALTGEGETNEQYNRLLERGVGAVVLTLGEEGAIAASREDVATISAPPVKVVDVTGAGDALAAGTLHALLDGASLPEAVASACRLAARTCASEGAVCPAMESEHV